MNDAREAQLAAMPKAIADQMRKLDEKRAAIEAAKKTREAAALLPQGPDALLKAEQEALKKLERDEADAVAWIGALGKYGKGRVGKLTTSEGMIILRVMTEAELDAGAARVGPLQGNAQVTIVYRELALDQVVHPTRDRVREMCAARPGIWNQIYQLRDALADGDEAALEGKV